LEELIEGAFGRSHSNLSGLNAKLAFFLKAGKIAYGWNEEKESFI